MTTTTPMSEQARTHRLFLLRQAVARREASVLDLQSEPDQPRHVRRFARLSDDDAPREFDEPEDWIERNGR